jgi:hypothetical protein
MLLEVAKRSLMITGFVFVMMLAIEYVNTASRGAAQRLLRTGRWRQYLLAAALGATPGCLGAFAVVSLYAHGWLSLGALTACMIATSGDEAFVLLAMSPGMGLLLMVILFVTGLAVAWLTDRLRLAAGDGPRETCAELVIHEGKPCGPTSWRAVIGYWRPCSAQRGILVFGLLLFVAAIAVGEVGPKEWSWIRVSLLGASLFAGFVVATVPDHFLEEHLWEHVAKKHLPRIFAWTIAALVATRLITSHAGLGQWMSQNPLTLVLIAALLGIIPESGPHLLFVTLFAEGKVPFSVLLASSIVQDGHGMLPLLGDSLRSFALVKCINLAAGLLLGLTVLACGG